MVVCSCTVRVFLKSNKTFLAKQVKQHKYRRNKDVFEFFSLPLGLLNSAENYLQKHFQSVRAEGIMVM